MPMMYHEVIEHRAKDLYPMSRSSHEYRLLCALAHEARRALAMSNESHRVHAIIQGLCARLREDALSERVHYDPEQLDPNSALTRLTLK